VKRLLIVVLLALSNATFAQTLTRVSDAGGYWRATPAQPNGVLFMMLPGGLVPAQAYAFIAEHLATQGVTTIIPEAPLGILFLDFNKPERIRLSIEARGERFKKLV
jgi:hypothetical protein